MIVFRIKFEIMWIDIEELGFSMEVDHRKHLESDEWRL